MRRNLDEEDARRLLGGAPITLITSSYRGRHNVIPVAYVMPVSLRPPLIAISMSPSRYSYDIIHKTDEFALNIPSRRAPAPRPVPRQRHAAPTSTSWS